MAEKHPKVQVIIVAAGQGLRFKSKTPKPFVLLKKKTLIHYSLKVFESSPLVDSVIIAGHKDHLSRFKSLGRTFRKLKVVVPGGKTRALSVQSGLAVVDEDTDFILVHDAARPLIDAALVKRLIVALNEHAAVIAAVPVKSTIKRVNERSLVVEETLNRGTLWDVQTPQGFHAKILFKGHVQKDSVSATDDAMVVERLGVKVKVVLGDYRNIKITTPEDLNLAQSLL